MGCDISPMGNHNLDTSDISKLAADLFSRFNINITYGYYGEKNHLELLGIKGKDREFIVLDKLIKNPKFKTYRLSDDFYLRKKLVQKFGLGILNEKKYWGFYGNGVPDEDDDFRISESKCVEFPEYELCFNSGNENDWLSIHRGNYCNYGPYFSRWWTFCKFFTEKDYKDKEYLKRFTQFREKLKFTAEKLEGTKLYYLNDQSSVLEGVGQGSEFDLTWVDFENFVGEKTGNLLLDIPKFMTEKKYRKKFLRLKTYPLAMVDDFRDFE